MRTNPLGFLRLVLSVLVVALLGVSAAAAAPNLQSNVDIKALVLYREDLPLGFVPMPDRTISESRETDGVAVYDVTFARERTAENLAAGAFEVRSGVARTVRVEDAVLQVESTREAFLGEGWTTIGVPPLGDETLGLTQTTDGEGGTIIHYSYLFRKGAYILMVGIRGRRDATKLNDVVSLAILVSGRLDKATLRCPHRRTRGTGTVGSSAETSNFHAGADTGLTSGLVHTECPRWAIRPTVCVSLHR